MRLGGGALPARLRKRYKLHPSFTLGVPMGFGMSEGDIDIMLGPSTFTPNETINGKVKLKLPQPAQARSLTVEFYGEIEWGNKFERVFRVEQKLGGERAYKDGEVFDFSLAIPEQAKPPEAQGTFGSIHNLFVPKPRNWYVHAQLDIPMATDVNSRMSIYMRR